MAKSREHKMKTKLFAIKDKKMEFGNLYEMPNEGVAVRDFGQTCMRKAPDGQTNMLNQFPEDYCLCVIGEYDHETGVITICEPKVIAEASQYVTKTM